MPPVQPMLAKAVKGIPDPAKHGGLVFEPKWDGFRCLVFRDGDEVELASRNTKPLTRYFPEVVDGGQGGAAGAVRARRRDLRLPTRRPAGVRDAPGAHPPGRSRVRMLAEKTPAGFVAFDLLALGDESLVDGRSRCAAPALEEALAGVDPPILLTRTTTDPARPASGSSSSRAPGSTGWWPSRWARRTSRTPGRC